MRELIDAHVQMDLQRNVLQGLRQRIHSGEEIVRMRHTSLQLRAHTMQDNSIEVWEKGVKTLNSEYLRKTSRKKYGKDDRYQKFKESIWASHSSPTLATSNGPCRTSNTKGTARPCPRSARSSRKVRCWLAPHVC